MSILRDTFGLLPVNLVLIFACGCAGTRTAPRPDERATLSRVGLVLLPEDEALIPPEDRGKYLPCRVKRDYPQPPVPPHPAGYLIVGINKVRGAGAAHLREKLAAWESGEVLVLGIRRNPYRQDAPAWYEIEVKVRLPGPDLP